MSGKAPMAAREQALAALGAELNALITAFRAVTAEAAAAFEPPLTASGFHLLQWLSTDGPAKASQVADALRMDRSVISRLVRQLVAQGWVRVRPGETDGRSVQCELTPAGRKQLATAVACKSHRFIQHAQSLSDAELKQLSLLLRRFNASSHAD